MVPPAAAVHRVAEMAVQLLLSLPRLLLLVALLRIRRHSALGGRVARTPELYRPPIR